MNIHVIRKYTVMTDEDSEREITKDYFVHDLSDVQTSLIGENTKIWQFCVVLNGAKIGSCVNICSHCFIENDVFIGNNVTIKNGNFIYNGIILEDNVFIGPNVIFTNDKFPRSKLYLNAPKKILIKKGASVGGGAVILPGVTIGENAMIGAGAIITKDVPPDVVVFGVAADIQKSKKL